MAKMTLRGTIIKKLDARTVSVETFVMKTHPIYKKRYKVVKSYLADDANNEFKLGDIVIIEECRPLSKTKRFIVLKKVSTANMFGLDKIAGEEVLAADRKKEEKVEAK
ncbi:MAG: uS17 family ribosomal protein [Patescibacteria group bacterium]